jgi:uncharacterized protein (TIGR03067 family)
MRVLQVALAVALAAASWEIARGQLAAEADPEQAAVGLEGIWSVVSVASAGQTMPASRTKAMRFVFSKAKLTMRVADSVLAVTEYTIDAGQQPPVIRLVFQGQPTLGIYELSGDDLKICLSGSADRRPTAFVSEADSPNRMLFVLKRGDLGPTGWPPLVMNADGTGLRQLAALPKDMATGSPDWSPDGRRIAFDAWRLARNETYVQAHVWVVGVDGGGLADLGEGAMPSWSPDAKRMTFCQYSPNRGVWVMDADGKNPKLIDPEGWGSDWSPVANKIAYSRYDAGADLLMVVDPDSGEVKTIRPERPYRSIYWNPSWSPDGKSISIVGILPDETREVVVVSTEGESGKCRVLVTDKGDSPYKGIASMVAWDGNPDAILVPMRGPDDKRPQIYRLDPKGERPPERVAGQAPDNVNNSVAWSPDGKQIVFTSHEP